jgi:D-sedoheptulose 7-phosphate isomerase
MAFEDLIRGRLKDSIALKDRIIENGDALALIGEITKSIIKAYQNDRKVILFGNGGSAADAQHIAAEFVGKYYLDRDPLPAMALTVNTSSLTSIGNDYSFDTVFTRQLEAFAQEGDIVIGISTSGNSENVIQALQMAKEKGLVTIGFTGRDGGKVKDVVDYCLRIPSDDTPRIQEAHITVGHIICEIVEKELFGADGKRKL